MAKFLYSMQNVLDIKERLETQAKTEYAEMNNRLFIEEETMKRLGKRLDSYENIARSSASERLDIMEMRRCNEAIDIIKNQMTQQAVRIRIAQRNVDNAMKKLTEAVQDRKIHEKLKEKAFEQFKLDINAQEMKEIDETVSFKYNNKDEIDMAKKKDVNIDELDDESGKSGKLVSILVAMLIIVIWLVIFALLIKMNVGGIGSSLRPYLKNVPVVNKILPAATDEEIQEETGGKYKSLSEAVDRIKELEAQLDENNNNGNASAQTIAELQAEIARLKVFEENAQHYQELKDKFDTDVVYTDNAPDISEYKSWYESIDSENAAKLYEQVVKDLQYSQQVKDWAETYSKMDAKNAAAILEEMTGDTDLVSDILLCMTSKQRAAILAEMDPVYAAKLTVIMYPAKG